MTEQNPITPPPELVEQWIAEIWHEGTPVSVAASDLHIATQAAQWGSDRELEACVEWMGDSPVIWRGDPEAHPGFYLREARRPKLPSQAEKALASLEGVALPEDAWQAVQAALERLQELEALDD